MSNYLPNHKDFADLIKILTDEKGIEPGLVEKDYWIIRILYGLKWNYWYFTLYVF